MTTLKYILLLIITIIFSMSSCKKEIPVTTDYSGKEIVAIHSDSVLLKDGSSFVIPEDSVSKVFYLTRHAEKDTSIQDNPPLTAAGKMRAEKIAEIFKSTRIDAIYTTLTLRAMYTAEALSNNKAMKILPYDNKSLKDVLAKIAKDNTTNRIFWVGHQNTVPAIVNTLAGKEIFTNIFDDSDYGNLIIVVQYNSGNSDVYKLRY